MLLVLAPSTRQFWTISHKMPSTKSQRLSRWDDWDATKKLPKRCYFWRQMTPVSAVVPNYVSMVEGHRYETSASRRNWFGGAKCAGAGSCSPVDHASYYAAAQNAARARQANKPGSHSHT